MRTRQHTCGHLINLIDFGPSLHSLLYISVNLSPCSNSHKSPSQERLRGPSVSCGSAASSPCIPRCTESRLQSYREGWEAGAAVYGSWRGGPSHERPPRRCHKATGSFTIRPLVHSGGRICFWGGCSRQRRFLGCLFDHDAALAVLICTLVYQGSVGHDCSQSNAASFFAVYNPDRPRS